MFRKLYSFISYQFCLCWRMPIYVRLHFEIYRKKYNLLRIVFTYLSITFGLILQLSISVNTSAVQHKIVAKVDIYCCCEFKTRYIWCTFYVAAIFSLSESIHYELVSSCQIGTRKLGWTRGGQSRQCQRYHIYSNTCGWLLGSNSIGWFI